MIDPSENRLRLMEGFSWKARRDATPRGGGAALLRGLFPG